MNIIVFSFHYKHADLEGQLRSSTWKVFNATHTLHNYAILLYITYIHTFLHTYIQLQQLQTQYDYLLSKTNSQADTQRQLEAQNNVRKQKDLIHTCKL